MRFWLQLNPTATFKASKLIAIQATESTYTMQKPFRYSIKIQKVPALHRQRSVNSVVFNGKLLYHILCGLHVWTLLGTTSLNFLELQQLLKRGVGTFSKVVIFLSKNTPTSHAVSLVQDVYACSDSAMPFLSSACLCNNNKWCLPSSVSPSPCTVLLLLCFRLNITTCTAL